MTLAKNEHGDVRSVSGIILGAKRRRVMSTSWQVQSAVVKRAFRGILGAKQRRVMTLATGLCVTCRKCDSVFKKIFTTRAK
jgi:hypothetical protein